MSSRNYQLRRSRQRKERRKQRAKPRRPTHSPLAEQGPRQSALSTRWIKEAPEKGRCAKLEAIYKLQEEAEQGNDVGGSAESLAKLITDPDKEVARSAAWAAGICASKGANPMVIIPPIIDLLHSEDDLDVETAIEMLGECARNPNHLARKVLFTKLSLINKDGASDATKANAGFALAGVLETVPGLVHENDLRRIALSCFLDLLRSDHYQSKVSGALGIGWMAISYARSGDSKHTNSMLKSLPVISDNVLSDVVLSSTLACAHHCSSCLSPAILQSALLMLVYSVNTHNVQTAKDVIEYGLDLPKDRVPLLEMLFGAGVTAHRVLSGYEFEPWRRQLVQSKKDAIEELIRYGRSRAESQGKRIVVQFGPNSKGLKNSLGLPSSVDTDGLA